MKKTYPITAPTLEMAAETALFLAGEDGINPAHVARIDVEQAPGDNRPGSFDVTVEGLVQPVDTAGGKLLPGTVYRFTDPSGDYPFFAIYHDAVVEDDASLTLVIEFATGVRNGLEASRNRVEPIVPRSPSLPEPTLARAHDGDR